MHQVLPSKFQTYWLLKQTWLLGFWIRNRGSTALKCVFLCSSFTHSTFTYSSSIHCLQHHRPTSQCDFFFPSLLPFPSFSQIMVLVQHKDCTRDLSVLSRGLNQWHWGSRKDGAWENIGICKAEAVGKGHPSLEITGHRKPTTPFSCRFRGLNIDQAAFVDLRSWCEWYELALARMCYWPDTVQLLFNRIFHQPVGIWVS